MSGPTAGATLLAEIDEANKEGFRITAQVRSRPTSVLLGFELSQNPFMGRPSYKAIAHLPFAERLAELRKPEFRARILQEAFEGGGRERRVDRWDRMFPFGDPPDYEPKAESSIAARAAREGRTPEEVAYDLLLQRDGREMLYLPVTNFAAGNLDVVREMIAAPNTLIGLGDGGAHVGIMCDATATSYTLTHWTRDRGRLAVPGGVGHQAAGGGQCRGDRAQRSRRVEGRDEGRHQHPGLRQHAAAQPGGGLRPAGRRQAPGPAHRRLRCDDRVGCRRVPARRADRGVAGAAGSRRARGFRSRAT